MVFRLSIVTTLMAVFALSFSALVNLEAGERGPLAGARGCYDQGAICVR